MCIQHSNEPAPLHFVSIKEGSERDRVNPLLRSTEAVIRTALGLNLVPDEALPKGSNAGQLMLVAGPATQACARR